MPASMNFNRYSALWLELFDHLCENPTENHVVECDSVEQAKGLRLEFYKARKAIFISEQDFKDKDPVGYAQMGHGALDSREVRVLGNSVHFGCKDSNRVSELLRASLAAVCLPKPTNDKGE